jgi:hypothetical protein
VNLTRIFSGTATSHLTLGGDSVLFNMGSDFCYVSTIVPGKCCGRLWRVTHAPA